MVVTDNGFVFASLVLCIILRVYLSLSEMEMDGDGDGEEK